MRSIVNICQVRVLVVRFRALRKLERKADRIHTNLRKRSENAWNQAYDVCDHPEWVRIAPNDSVDRRERCPRCKLVKGNLWFGW